MAENGKMKKKPDEREETWQRKFGPKVLANKYEIALDKLEESIWKHQTPRRLRSRGRQGERCVRVEFPIKWNFDRKNRSKRKREYRQDKREEYLRKMATRENLVRTLSAEGSSFRRNEVEFLLHVQYGRQYDYHSVTQDTGSRLAYILESMTQYQLFDLTKYDETELEIFRKSVMQHLGYTNMLFGMQTEDYEKKEVKVTLLLNKR